jgi:hypothetical protein
VDCDVHAVWRSGFGAGELVARAFAFRAGVADDRGRVVVFERFRVGGFLPRLFAAGARFVFVGLPGEREETVDACPLGLSGFGYSPKES